MYRKISVLLLSLVCSSPIWAFKCYFTLAKANCWQKYDVTVQIKDAISSKIVSTIVVPADKLWARQAFACEKAQKLLYQAQFTPVIWESERGKTYYAKEYWSMPGEIKAKSKAWHIPVCFPGDFSEVPMPPQQSGKCACDFSTIPVIPPE